MFNPLNILPQVPQEAAVPPMQEAAPAPAPAVIENILPPYIKNENENECPYTYCPPRIYTSRAELFAMLTVIQSENKNKKKNKKKNAESKNLVWDIQPPPPPPYAETCIITTEPLYQSDAVDVVQQNTPSWWMQPCSTSTNPNPCNRCSCSCTWPKWQCCAFTCCGCYKKTSDDARCCGACACWCPSESRSEQCSICPNDIKEYCNSGYVITESGQYNNGRHESFEDGDCCCTLFCLPVKFSLFFSCCLGALFNTCINCTRDTDLNYLW